MANKAVVFAGQGAQFAGMGKDIADAFPECSDLFKRADEVLGFALSDICFRGPADLLTKSNYCQPGIFVTSMACYMALINRAGNADWSGTAGLSLGEWTALHMAGAISFEDSLVILEARGRFMQEACEATEGGMVSVIGLPAEKLTGICEKSGVYIANLNSESQTVLSGPKKGIEDAARLATEAGAKKTVLLNVAGAFHSPLMAPAADRLAEVLERVEFKSSEVPVISNVTGRPHGRPEEIKATMLKQVTGSVRWFDGINWLKNNGVTGYVECGPGNVLSGLIKRIDKTCSVVNVQDIGTLEKAVEAIG